MQLRNARLIHAELFSNRLHRRIAEIVERDQFLIAGRQAGHRLAHAQALLVGFIDRVGAGGFGGHQHSVVRILVTHIGGRLGRRRFDGRNAHHRALQVVFVLAQCLGQLGQRGLVSQPLAQRHSRRFNVAADAAHTARPGVLAQRVDHRATDAAFGEGFELDAPCVIEALCGINQSEHSVLDQIAHLDRVRHRRGHAPRQGLNERKAGRHAVAGKRIEHLHAPFWTQARCQKCAITNLGVKFLLSH